MTGLLTINIFIRECITGWTFSLNNQKNVRCRTVIVISVLSTDLNAFKPFPALLDL